MLRTLISATLLLAGLAQAGLSDMRATIPGSLHQCQNISVFFFDTDDSGPKTLLLVGQEDSSKLGSGTITLDDALSKVQPLQTISNIDSADAASFPFFLKIQQDTSFSTFGFLSNRQGKNLNLERSVARPLPDATECLSQVDAPATTAASVPVAVATPKSTPPATTSAAAAPSKATTSGFVKALKAASSSTPAPAPPASSPVATTPPAAIAPSVASVSSAAVAAISSNTSNTASGAASSPSTAVINTKYLLTSFISISPERTTDGTVTSAAIVGGHITGNYNGTILAVGSALFAPNVTAPEGATVANATDDKPSTPLMLLSATYTFTVDDGKNAGDAVFVMAQTPLSTNATVPALLMHLQPATSSIGRKWENKTVLGKPEFINSTMFRIDAYVA